MTSLQNLSDEVKKKVCHDLAHVDLLTFNQVIKSLGFEKTLYKHFHKNDDLCPFEKALVLIRFYECKLNSTVESLCDALIENKMYQTALFVRCNISQQQP